MAYFKHFLLALTLLATSACGYFQVPYFQIPLRIEPPEVDVVSVKFHKASLFEQRFKAQLRLHNPNSVDLPVYGLDMTLHLEKVRLGEASSSQHFIVPAGGESTIDIDVRTNLFSNLMKLKKIIGKKPSTLHYRLRGDIDIGLLFAKDIYINSSGTLPTPKLPKL